MREKGMSMKVPATRNSLEEAKPSDGMTVMQLKQHLEAMIYKVDGRVTKMKNSFSTNLEREFNTINEKIQTHDKTLKKVVTQSLPAIDMELTKVKMMHSKQLD